ncbi:uncharacterized protein LOC128677919 [Plodia interpunctella]|uniref:uncharacterized protein LOC128677919 n=1 Tax=Plodia interpunctella TaxID=58824 RepID=UPI002367F44F|nr:uncharacterized protein LOC128677919 [Plodia interpunctella]
MYFTYNTPNIVVYTRSLSNIIFTNPVATVLFQSHWSIVNIVVVSNRTYACEDSHFSKEVNSSIYKFLNDFWNKYQMVYVVIEYPDDCPGKFSTYDGNKQPSHKVGQFYKRTFKTVNASDVHETLMQSARNLTQDYPLRANIFFRFPTSVTDCDSWSSFIKYNSDLTNGYCGLDAIIMHDIMQILKFNVTFEMKNITSYGYVQHGHVTGTLGLIVEGKIDVSFNSRFMVMYSANLRFNFLYHIWSDSLCAMMKEPDEIPLWHYPFNIYRTTTWVILISCLTLIGSMMYVTSRLIGAMRLKFYIYIINAVWSSLFGFFFDRRIKRSLLAAICLLSSVVLTAKYQGHVNYMFTTLARYDKIQSLQQMCDRGIQIYAYPSIAALLEHETLNMSKTAKTTLVENLKYYETNETATERNLPEAYALKRSDTATVVRSDALLWTLFNLTDEDGRPLLYAPKECFEHYYLSFIVRPGFLFTSHIQVLIMKIVEAGLPSMYNKWARYTHKVVDPGMEKNTEARKITIITIYEQRVAFYVLLVGYVLSVIVFVIEFWLDTRAKRAMNDLLVQTYIN